MVVFLIWGVAVYVSGAWLTVCWADPLLSGRSFDWRWPITLARCIAAGFRE